MLVEALLLEYIEALLDIEGSTKLVVEAFDSFRLDALYKLIFPGDGSAGNFRSKSLSL